MCLQAPAAATLERTCSAAQLHGAHTELAVLQMLARAQEAQYPRACVLAVPPDPCLLAL